MPRKMGYQRRVPIHRFSRLRVVLLALSLSAGFAPSASAVVGGTPVPAGERGYVVFITIDQVAACTGTLVSPTFILTASHCSSLLAGTPINVPIAKQGAEIAVALGSVRANDPDDMTAERPRVKRVIVHPKATSLDGNGFRFDVALLELETPSKQRPVQVVAKGEEALFAPGTMTQIAGYGATQEGGDAADQLLQTEVPVVTDATARAAYPDSFDPVDQIGAGFPQGGKDSCQGDSGGPLLVAAPGATLRLAGATSYGDGCARPNRPGIYARLGGEIRDGFIAQNAPAAIAQPSQPQPQAAQPAPAAGGMQQPPQQGAQPIAKKKTTKKRSACRAHPNRARHRRSRAHRRYLARGGRCGRLTAADRRFLRARAKRR